MSITEYSTDLDVRGEEDDTAAPQQDSQLGQQYYYVEDGLMSAACGPHPVVTLACSACQLVYIPDPADFDRGNTGCPRCGGWTWIAQLIPAPREGGDHS